MNKTAIKSALASKDGSQTVLKKVAISPHDQRKTNAPMEWMANSSQTSLAHQKSINNSQSPSGAISRYNTLVS